MRDFEIFRLRHRGIIPIGNARGAGYTPGSGGLSAPVNTVLPAITGTAQVGATLTSSTGTWSNTPTSYAYQWKSAGSNVGTNANTYVPVTGDIGNTITVVVTATNATGSTPATSAATSAVIAFTPAALSSLASWLDPTNAVLPAAYPSGLPTGGWYVYSAGVTGSPASAWADQYTLGVNWAQATAGRRPSVVADGLTFDGSDDSLYSSTNPAHANDFTLAVQLKPTSLSSGEVLLSRGVSGSTLSWQMAMTSAANLSLTITSDGSTATSYTIHQPTAGTWVSIVVRKSGVNIDAWVNGLVASLSTGASATIFDASALPLNIGANGASSGGAGTGNFATEIGRVAYFASALTNDLAESISREWAAEKSLAGPGWGGRALSGPYPFARTRSNITVYEPDGASPVAGNVSTSGRYALHTRIYRRSGILYLMHSLGLANEDGHGQWSYLRISSDNGATWGSPIELIPAQDTVSATQGGIITYPSFWTEYGGALYAIIAVHDYGAGGGGDRLGLLMAARTVASDGTLGSLFRITPDDYTPASGVTKINYDGTLGPPLLLVNDIYAHWGGDDANSHGQTWSRNYYATVPSTIQLNERSAVPDPYNAGQYIAVYKRKQGLTANRIPYAILDSDGVPTAVAATDMPHSPNASNVIALPDGRWLFTDCPVDTGAIVRDPLFLAITDPGRRTVAMLWSVRQNLSSTPEYSGTSKTGGGQYSHAVVDGDDLWISYGKQKERIICTRMGLPRQVATWTDSNGVIFRPGYTYASRPIKITSPALGVPLVFFDGTGTQVSQTTSLPTGSAGMCCFAVRPAKVFGTQYLLCVADTGTSNNFWAIRLLGSKIEVVSSAGATVNSVRGSTTLVINATYIVTVESTGTAWTIRINGVAESLTVTAGSNNGDWCSDVSGPDVYGVGALIANTTSGYYLGYLGHITLTGIAAAGADRSNTETYVTAQSGSLTAFTPTSVSGIALWLAADQGTNQTVSGSAAAADADPVGEWQDQSGNSRHHSQGTAGFRPLLKLNVQNGLPGILYDGVDDFLSNASAFLTGTAGVVLAVVRASSVTGAHNVFASADNASTNRYVVFRTVGTNIEVAQSNADTADRMQCLAPNNQIAIGNTYLIDWRSSGTAYTVGVKTENTSMNAFSGANNGDWFGDTSARDNTTVGAWTRTSTDDWFAGHIFEIIVIDGAVSDGDLASLRTYLNGKWQLY